VVLFAGAAAFTIPAKAGTDPAAFINNLGYQLQAVNRNTSPEQRPAFTATRSCVSASASATAAPHFMTS